MVKAFTIMEVTFVIVIIGVLAAIALPKLVTTSQDTRGATLANDLALCIDEASMRYMKIGSFGNITQPGINQSTSCRKANVCFDFIENDSNGSLAIINELNTTSKQCKEAQRIANHNTLSTIKIFKF